jgi:hypothetical protein
MKNTFFDSNTKLFFIILVLLIGLAGLTIIASYLDFEFPNITPLGDYGVF